jgi:hypothetical protein
MTYQNVIYVDYDPGADLLNGLRGLELRKVYEADLMIVKKQGFIKKTGLMIAKLVVVKDRYQKENRLLTQQELMSIMLRTEKLKIVSK